MICLIETKFRYLIVTFFYICFRSSCWD